MKKNKYIALLVVLALLLALVGCGGTNAGSAQADSAGEGSSVEEIEYDAYITLDGYYHTLVISTNDDAFPTYETQSIAYAGAVGMTLREAMAAIGDESIEVIAEGDEFEGWMEFVLHIEPNEDGFDIYTYERVSDTLYTTEEVLEKTFAAEEMVYAAKWASMDMESYYAAEDDWEDGGDGYTWTSDMTGIQLDADGGTMTFQYLDGEIYDWGSYTYWVAEGESINTVAGNPETGYDTLLSVQKEGAEFANWTVYMGDSLSWSDEVSTEDGAMSLKTSFDSEDIVYAILGNGVLYQENVTTEELLALVSDGFTHYYAVANWN